MTDAALAALVPPARPDPAFGAMLEQADLELNRALAPVFTGVARFADYAADDPATGIYHPVAACARDLLPNDQDPMPAPNGLGDLCADAMRAVANAPGPGADPAPFSAAAVATGELRGGLASGAPITFADLYGILPLGRSPDPAQDGATGEPAGFRPTWTAPGCGSCAPCSCWPRPASPARTTTSTCRGWAMPWIRPGDRGLLQPPPAPPPPWP